MKQKKYQKKGLLKTLQPMSWPERIEHIWLNYKVQIALIICIPALFIAVGVSIYNNRTNLLIAGIVTNVNLTDEGLDYISDRYFDYLEGDKALLHEVRVETVSFKNLTESSNPDYDYYSAINAVNKAQAGTLDYLFLNQYAMEIYIVQEILLDLREVFTEEELAQFQEDGLLITAQPEGSEDIIPLAINISNLAFVQDCVTSPSTVYFAFTKGSDRVDSYRTFWEYLLAWEPSAE